MTSASNVLETTYKTVRFYLFRRDFRKLSRLITMDIIGTKQHYEYHASYNQLRIYSQDYYQTKKYITVPCQQLQMLISQCPRNSIIGHCSVTKYIVLARETSWSHRTLLCGDFLSHDLTVIPDACLVVYKATHEWRLEFILCAILGITFIFIIRLLGPFNYKYLCVRWVEFKMFTPWGAFLN